MKTPWYETSAGAVVALLLTKTFVQCNLYTLTLFDGTIYRYTTSTRDVNIGGNVWSAQGVQFDADPSGINGLISLRRGLNVATWQTMVAVRPADAISGEIQPDLLGSTPWLKSARSGVLDGAEIQISRAVFSAWQTAGATYELPVGAVTIFRGRMGAVDILRSRIVLTFNSHVELLNLAMPRNVVQSQCTHTLFDSACQLVASSYARNGVVSGGNNYAITSAISAPSGSATYTLGRLVMTSGDNKGLGRAVRNWSGGVFTLLSPFYFTINIGDTFTAYPGCDKALTSTTGCTGFSNTANFRGEPFTPVPEVAV